MNDEVQILSLNIPTGATVQLTNGSSRPLLYRFECGEFGFVEFVLPMGSKFRFKPGTIVPKIIVDDVKDEAFNGDNVIEINKED